MQKTDCHVGMQVIFGRTQGEKTVGEVVKMNPKKAKVRILENRGRRSSKGEVWGVPYELMLPNVPAKYEEEPQKIEQEPQKIEHVSIIDRHILQAIACCYADLSPENLTCDGELPPSQSRQRASALNRKLRGLFQAYGREVGEFEIYEWNKKQQDQKFTAKKMLGHC